MWITGMRTQGLAPVSELELQDLPRAAYLSGPPERCEQVAIALQLFFAALLPERVPRVLVELGFAPSAEGVEVIGQPLPDQARWSSPWAARALLDEPEQRKLEIRLSMALDPLQFRFLREHAARHPWLVTALAEGARAEIAVGWLFDTAHEAAVISVLEVVLGEERVPVAGPESPAWLPAFLQGLARRFRALPPAGGSLPQAARGWLAALTHPSPQRQAAAEALRSSLEAAPFGLVAPRPVRWGEAAAVVAGPRGRPLPWLGTAAVEAVELAAAVHLSGAEILCLRRPGIAQDDPTPTRDWLRAAATAPGSPLEQVIMLEVAHPEGRDLGEEERER